ncbi:MAG TPA: UDP-N-acetylmuramoyl-L-alanyl-D-glutamate--2,6-diaminopimelate ligase [Elusimicrobia bacterium]|jgi:UDP-N-acetylmuramoyl-L-alanyl-D-glutamate--2,6-diaminopimelate ligase|nr:UDP-N-acetylmuramoyl-L-alanyl-D-glutamate--2,6-diaminopimelate ligase [Elusimicrobiota bacterium]
MPKLKNLLEGIRADTQISLETEITGIAYDSRKVKPGNLFVVRQGVKDHGRNYLTQAKDNGAVAVVSEEKIIYPLPLILVADVHLALAKLAANFYQNPSKELLLIGVTGTNGKTTITYLLESILNSAGRKTGVIGTINYRLGKKIFAHGLTTPEAVDLQAIFSWMREEGADSVIMEVSSHALAQGRTAECYFDLGIFTNLTDEHLDFHQTMDNYFAAKSKLFTAISPEIKQNLPKFAIINLDSQWGEKLINLVKLPVLTYGIKKKSDFQAKEIKLEEKNSSFLLRTQDKEFPVRLPLVGKYNILNALAAIACASAIGINRDLIIKNLAKINSIPGRLEPVDRGQDYSIFVDYAHTADALENVLFTLKEFAKRKIITVFGCGGDRDRSKRPLMGEVATRLSDFVIITSDNPRSEDPQQIALDIEVGIRRAGKENYKVIIDRRQAIRDALTMAGSGDFILIAGKGHEDYQIFADRTIHFDDKEIVNELLKELSRK